MSIIPIRIPLPAGLPRTLCAMGLIAFLLACGFNTFAAGSVTPDEKIHPRMIITGTVLHATTRAPLAGATVQVKGSKRSVVTDENGKFSIEANTGDVLVISYVGFEQQEYKAARSELGNILLVSAQTSLEEVVVNKGYYNTTKDINTGSVAKVSAAEIARQPVTNPLLALHGRMAGVYVEQASGVPGAGVTLRIRGQNSLRLEANEPFYIVDGVPFTSATISNPQTYGAAIGVSPFNSIDPGNIEAIEVLKDADATAIYGSRGANGVVLITTKRGKAGKPAFEMRFSQGAGRVGHMMDLLNRRQYIDMRLEALRNDGLTPTALNARDLVQWDTTRETDWQNVLIGGTASQTNTHMSFSGGNDQIRYMMSGGYYRETTVFPGEDAFQKGSGSFSLNYTSLNNKLNVSLSNSFVFDVNRLQETDMTGLTNSLVPVAPKIYNDDGTLNWQNSTWANPFAALQARYTGKTQNLLTNFTLSYEFLRHLRFKVSMGYNNLQMKETILNPSTVYNPAFGALGNARLSHSVNRSWIVEPQVEYRRMLGKGELVALVGAAAQEGRTESEAIAGYDINSDLLLENISAAAIFFIFSDYSQYKYNGIFGRVSYDWQRKYVLNLTARRDGSSRFGPGRQFGNFGSAGAAWIFSREAFMQDISFLSFGKLRTSYGSTGSDQIANYGFMDTYINTNHRYDGEVGLAPTRLFNPDFGWETNHKLEAAVELGFLKDRILLSVSHYRNRTKGQLVGYPLPDITGFPDVSYNMDAVVQNTGWEFELSTENMRQEHFGWTTRFNLSIPRNKLLKYPGIEVSSYANTYKVGEPLTVNRRYIYTGVDPNTGIYQFVDRNNDNLLTSTNDAVFINKRGVKFYGGLENNISWKALELNFFLQFSKRIANDWYTSGSFTNVPGSRFSNQHVDVLRRWQKPGDQTDVAAFTTTANNVRQSAMISSDRSLVDVSFIRLKNLSLSWKLPVSVGDVRIFAQGQNLLTFTSFKGRDPESLEAAALPPLRMLTAGFNCKF